MKTVVILNEHHNLLESQKTILKDKFGEYEILSVPHCGWSLSQQDEILQNIQKYANVVFASPVPVLLSKVSKYVGYGGLLYTFENKPIMLNGFIFHNDNREKVELPNGKIISVIAKEGWQLVEI